MPPTIALCREHSTTTAPSSSAGYWPHQVGAAIVAFLAGLARDTFGTYGIAWMASGALCAAAALMALVIRRPDVS